MKYLMIFGFILVLSACGTRKNGKKELRPIVLIDFNIETQQNSGLNFINMDYFKLKVLDQLENFQNVNLTLAEPDEKAAVTLNMNIDNFILWPRDERVSRRTLSRVVQSGTNAAGKPVYETVRASADVIQVQRRSNARFNVELKYKDKPEQTFKRNFSPNYNYSNTYIENIQGDSRAVDPRLYFSRNSGMEPQEIDFLLRLSNEMVQRISSELRKYYSKE